MLKKIKRGVDENFTNTMTMKQNIPHDFFKKK